MKWFRWKGLIAFIILIVLLSCFWFILADTLTRRVMEKTATALVGAEVDISDVDLTLSPLGISVFGLEVTNPNDPLTNAVEVKKISCSLDTAQIFLRKVIIDQMSITGMRFNTQRHSPGFVKKPREDKKEAPPGKDSSTSVLPGFTKPDISAILKDEDLKTLHLIQDMQGEIRSKKALWEKKLREIPDQKQLKQYQDRIERIKKTDKRDPQSILSAGTQLKSLQNDIKTDIKSLKDAQVLFSNNLQAINAQMKMVQEAPGEDIRNLIKKYGPSPAGIGNVSALFFGDKTGEWVQRALQWYQRISPLIEKTGQGRKDKKIVKPLRAKGLDVHFREYAPLPDFLIRSASASLNLNAGIVKGTFKNITPDQDIIGSPLTFDFSGDRLKGLTGVHLTGYMNRTDPAQSRDHLELTLSGYGLNKVHLGTDGFPLMLEKGILDAHVITDIINDNISAQLKSTVSTAQVALQESKGVSELYSSLASAFSHVNGFTLTAELKGTTDQYTVRLSSDLEKVMASALNKAVSDLAKQFEQDMRTAVQAKTSAPLNALKNDAGSLDEIGKELSTRISLADTLLKNTIAAPSKNGALKLPF